MMQQSVALVCLAIVFTTCSASSAVASSKANPIEKVVEMMSDLQQKIIGEGNAAQKVYDESAEWCEEESKNLQFTIKTGKANAEELTAVIGLLDDSSQLLCVRFASLDGKLQVLRLLLTPFCRLIID